MPPDSVAAFAVIGVGAGVLVARIWQLAADWRQLRREREEIR